ncbi:MAG TPA: M56 family metallopeptidase [Myxococcota bacterium]|nr:M56 family metallopeptidase [Myxococcota bacterium]
MDALLRLLLTNAAAAGLLAVLAFAVSRVVRRPALAHGLWLVALLKLVTPPVVPLPLLPAWRSLPALTAKAPPMVVPMGTRLQPAPAATADTAALSRAHSIRHTEGAAPPTRATLVRPAIAIALAGGALCVLLLGAVRFARFRRLLAHAEPAPAAILKRADAIAGALGLRRVPPLRVVAAAIPPMLWPEPSGPVLLLPRDLLDELTPDERDALLAHELAHVHRRDHWVRLLELLATALFWWYPVAWWARAALRRAEERCCDEWVLRVLPRSAEAYANGLLKSLSFVSAASAPIPALASGASPLYELETRLKEILMSRPAPRLAAPLRIALLAAAGLGLAVFPIDARNDEPAPAAKPARPADAAKPAGAAPAAAAPIKATPATARAASAAPAPTQAATSPQPAAVPGPAQAATAAPAAAPVAARPSRSEEERKIEAAQRAFEQKRRELERQELELRRQEVMLHARAEQEEFRACAEKLRAEGRASEAESCERRGELAAKRAELDRHKVELEAQRVELDAKQMAEARALAEQLERAGGDGREAQIVAINERMKVLEADRRRSAELRMRQNQSVRQVSEEFARAFADQVEAWKAQLKDHPEARLELEQEIRRLDAALKALEAKPQP